MEQKKTEGNDIKKEKMYKRLLVDSFWDDPVTDTVPVLHSGLTGGLNKLMRPVLPPSPDYSGGDTFEPSPASPLALDAEQSSRQSYTATESLGSASSKTEGKSRGIKRGEPLPLLRIHHEKPASLFNVSGSSSHSALPSTPTRSHTTSNEPEKSPERVDSLTEVGLSFSDEEGLSDFLRDAFTRVRSSRIDSAYCSAASLTSPVYGVHDHNYPNETATALNKHSIEGDRHFACLECILAKGDDLKMYCLRCHRPQQPSSLWDRSTRMSHPRINPPSPAPQPIHNPEGEDAWAGPKHPRTTAAGETSPLADSAVLSIARQETTLPSHDEIEWHRGFNLGLCRLHDNGGTSQMQPGPQTNTMPVAFTGKCHSRLESKAEEESSPMLREAAMRDYTPGDTGDDASDTPESRSPSPWQSTNSVEAEQLLAQSLWYLVNRLGHGIPSSQVSTDSSPHDSGEDSPTNIRQVGTGSSSGEGPPATDSPFSASNQDSTNPRQGGFKRPADQSGDSDDGYPHEPNGKRRKSMAPDRHHFRPRFACPYQKFDPVGSAFCCSPNTRNPEGGAETFSRVKSHIFRNHDPFVRCSNCWKMCNTEDEAGRHQHDTNCIQKASPGKYWMSREQRDRVRQQKFVSSNVDNWYCLFSILLPAVPAKGPNGYKRHSPYYTLSPPGPPTPASSSASSRHRSIFGGQDERSEPTPPSTQQTVDSFQIQGPQSGDDDAQLSASLDGISSHSTVDSSFGQANSNGITMRLPELANQQDTGVDLVNRDSTIPSIDPSWFSPSLDPGLLGLPRTEPTPLPNVAFLQQDNSRLRNNNTQLQDEVQMLREQLDDLRGRVQPLDRSLQELLYLPGVQNSTEGIASRVFAALEEIASINRVLGQGLKKK